MPSGRLSKCIPGFVMSKVIFMEAASLSVSGLRSSLCHCILDLLWPILKALQNPGFCLVPVAPLRAPEGIKRGSYSTWHRCPSRAAPRCAAMGKLSTAFTFVPHLVTHHTVGSCCRCGKGSGSKGSCAPGFLSVYAEAAALLPQPHHASALPQSDHTTICWPRPSVAAKHHQSCQPPVSHAVGVDGA